MSTGQDLPYTYSGLLDDVMARYGPQYSGKAYFQRMIAKNLFFGGGMYINDGYLVNHPVARYYLGKEQSLLRAMMRYGFITILTRERTPKALAKMPSKMARQKNASFQQLVRSSEWKNGFRKTWYALADAAFDAQFVRPWPNRNMSYGFSKLIGRALLSKPEETGIAASENTLLHICEEFFARRPLQSGPRDKLEKAAKSVVDDSGVPAAQKKAAVRSIMNVANQAYHYNFGLCLTSETGARMRGAGAAVCVDTTVGKAFDEMLLTEEIDAHVLRTVPLFGIPDKFRFDDGRVFEPLVIPGSRAYAAKVKFAETVGSAILARSRRNRTVHQMREQVKDAMTNYAVALVRELPFSTDERRFFDKKGNHTVFVAPGLMKDDSPAAIGAEYPVITHAIALASKRKGLEFLVQRGVLSTKKPFHLGEVRPQISSLLFDKAKAEDFVSDIPPVF